MDVLLRLIPVTQQCRVIQLLIRVTIIEMQMLRWTCQLQRTIITDYLQKIRSPLKFCLLLIDGHRITKRIGKKEQNALLCLVYCPKDLLRKWKRPPLIHPWVVQSTIIRPTGVGSPAVKCFGVSYRVHSRRIRDYYHFPFCCWSVILLIEKFNWFWKF